MSDWTLWDLRLVRWATRVALLAFGLSLVYAVASHRAFYGDGANYILLLLEERSISNNHPERAHAHLVFGLPLLTAVWLGVRDYATLELLFQIGSFLPWPLALWLCHRLAPHWLWMPMAAAALGYLNAAFLAWGEHIVAHAFFWPAAFALLLVRPLTPFAAAVLALCALVLVRSYEMQLFLGPCLAGLAGWRAVRVEGEAVWVRPLLFAAAALFLIGAGVAAAAVLEPTSARNYGDFRSGALALLTWPSKTLLWCLAAVATGTVLALFRLPAFSLLPLLPLLVAWPMEPLVRPEEMKPWQQHDYRVVQLLVPLGGLPLLLLLARRPAWLRPRRPILAALAALLLLLQSLWHLGATLQWDRYLEAVRAVLANETGAVPLSSTSLADRRGFLWYWTLPSLSIALQGDKGVRALLYNDDGWHPFEIDDPAELPQLGAFGVDYTPYLDALAEP